ncbi:LytR C-terminal domain-containing protein [Blastococcus brunescens]|uniref:LytR C-terminal domain-containing protein n=1 Tax=Blastococcus brunescens TaxID=1564165 RepID=A0ABZ1B8W0_9ACTN|nr:LytR C-terminal domain-containing protein [Blastococcus sp. BMG 8361]WRL67169.1 LytR C-terminal domain-containing protein [Blastococcus sp. BMG 8361]
MDPITLNRFLNRAAEALTVDEQTNLGDLRTLAGSLGDLSGDAVQRAGLPVAQVGYVPAGTDQAYVLLDGTGTRALFDAVIEGTQVPEQFVLGPEEPAAAPEEAPTGDLLPPPEAAPADTAPTVPPSSVTVDVLNGTATTGLAATVADLMRAQGFVVAAVGNEPGTVSQSVVRHGPDGLEQARTVAAAVPGAVLQSSDDLAGTVQLVVGPGYSSVVPVTIAPAPEAAAADVTEPAAAEPEPAPVTC